MADINIGSYIFERVKQLGVKSVFGVPGGMSIGFFVSCSFNSSSSIPDQAERL